MGAAEQMFEETSVGDREAAVDEAIRQAGGNPRDAIYGLIVQLQEREEARALIASKTSLGYVRGRQPLRQRP